MELEGVASPEPLIDTDDLPSIDTAPPAPGAEEQKPNAEPASDADAQKTETPEQKQEARKESRRARQARQHAIELGEARAEARILREQLAARQPQPETGEPKREQFQDYESYLEARAEWRADRKVDERLKARDQASQGRAEQDKATERDAKAAQEWVKREKAFQTATKDYDEVVAPYVEEDLGRLSDVARRAIVDSEVGPQVLYHLANNPDEAERIAELSAHRQAVELGKLELKMSAPTKTASTAPAPIKHATPGRSAPNGYSDNMTDAEYRAWRKSNGAQWAR